MSRALPLINAVGCLVLTAVVVAQWRKEHTLDGELTAQATELARAREQTAQAERRRGAAERDIVVLKEALGETQRTAEETAANLAAKDEMLRQTVAELEAARRQIADWQTALQERDERIRKLDEELRNARKRLSEAVEKLKAAAKR